MINRMVYKSDTARVEFDPRDEIFVGRVLGIEDRITFHGETVAKLRAGFHSGIDHYLADCATQGRTPQRPYSGKILLRLPPRGACPCRHARRSQGQEPQPVGSRGLGTGQLILPASPEAIAY